MANDTFVNRLRSFLGVPPRIPRNDFRNPIWGSDDDEDDGDELYTRHDMDVQSQVEIQRELTQHMLDMFRSFGGMFGDMKTFLHDDVRSYFAEEPLKFEEHSADPDQNDSNSIRDYYLKPGYHSKNEPKDVDLDGKISSHEISGLLKKKDEGNNTVMPFDGNLVPGRSFCQTIITTSVTKPDGTIETRRIVKNGNEVIEETTTLSPDSRNPPNPGLSAISSTGIIMSELATLFRNFY